MLIFLNGLQWFLLGCLITTINSVAAKDPASQFTQWEPTLSSSKGARSNQGLANTVAKSFIIDINQLRILLLDNTSKNDDKIISVPLPSGRLINFRLTPSSIMALELEQRYPQIRTFTGTELGNAQNKGTFDITPNGFHAMFYYGADQIFIEPKSAVVIQTAAVDKKQKVIRLFNDNDHYLSYLSKKIPPSHKKTYQFHPPKRLTAMNLSPPKQPKNIVLNPSIQENMADQSIITTYRLAISAAAEYTEFNGGTVDTAMAEIITLVNRLNDVYQRDLAVKLELVNNNNLLVFTDPENDPFTNTDTDGEINTPIIDGLIGSSSYDIGHILGTGGGGLAALGAVCSPEYKGDGVSGSEEPNNDAFYIDYVAHEIGHQFGAEHTFNGTEESCGGGNRFENSAYEVGSGSTIMAYAGICSSQNLQQNSDAFFHTRSIDEINTFISGELGSSCGTDTGEVNNDPLVNAGLDYTIPARTPFVLSGSATDIEATALTYSWQQFDLGNASASVDEQIDDGTRPLFRALSPVSNSDRVLPKLESLLSNKAQIGEVFPTTDRALNFRLLVRDGDGGVSFDANKITVVDTGEAFAVLTPSTSDIWSSNNESLSWQVAQTNIAPISCTSVDILLSTDGGGSFTKTLISATDNDGNMTVSLSSYCANDVNTREARVKVACHDNIFFAINDSNFIIDKPIVGTDIVITGQQDLAVNQGDSLTLTNNLFSYRCDTPNSFSIENGANYRVSGMSIIPNSDFFGELTVGVISMKDSISSDVFNAKITVVEQVVVPPVVAPPVVVPPVVVPPVVVPPVVVPPVVVPPVVVPPVIEEAQESSGSMFWLLTATFMLVIRKSSMTHFNSKFG